MANKGWSGVGGDGTIGDGPARASNSRTTGRCTPVDAAATFIPPNPQATPGPNADPLNKRSDLYEVRGQMTGSGGAGGPDMGPASTPAGDMGTPVS